MHIAIIGAGAAGLTSARHVSAQGFQCEVFEMAPELGGTWVYTDFVEKDQFGYPVHTSMYKDLRANLPKEVMGFSDFPIPEQDECFLPQEDILQFLNLYTDHFNLRELIKFNEMVTDVRPFEDKWQITSIHKPTKQETTKIIDVVMVCNGHYHTPSIPNIPGVEKFKGRVMHCHDYRSAESFKDQKVLIIGAGPSGLDVTFQVATVAHSIVISHHEAKREIKGEYPVNVSKKPEVALVKNGNEVEFLDGSCCCFDTILYCTGYRYSFPFLHESCGVTVENNHVQPLFKHMIHVERPTLCFIGIPFYVCAFQMFDLQARFYCQYLNGSMPLPSKQDMIKDLEDDLEKRRGRGYSKKQSHLLAHTQQEYYDDLSSRSNITNIPSVMSKIWSECDETFYGNLQDFRKYRYRILNNNSFVKLQ